MYYIQIETQNTSEKPQIVIFPSDIYLILYSHTHTLSSFFFFSLLGHIGAAQHSSFIIYMILFRNRVNLRFLSGCVWCVCALHSLFKTIANKYATESFTFYHAIYRHCRCVMRLPRLWLISFTTSSIFISHFVCVFVLGQTNLRIKRMFHVMSHCECFVFVLVVCLLAGLDSISNRSFVKVYHFCGPNKNRFCLC